MAKKPLLTREKIKVKYPNQWLLLEDFELDESTSLRRGRVIAHSKDRNEIHHALKKHRWEPLRSFHRHCSSGHRGYLLMPRVVFDPSVSSIVVDLLLEAADGRSSLVIPVVLDTGASLTILVYRHHGAAGIRSSQP